ncbi:translation initiation factor eIF-2B [Halonotius terrestris]|uniref:Translation initiation factor eIF-2B n=1 Tax=Halonotius terrestris TaxID=2487750 RepID=A0A8J8TCN8_9EURY|nr:translation initiation factor eIF-2B [Halonotius terrestris]TQQ82593.1 translation initiation factor eIF-2B [Halonotius terrestris]
MINETVEEIQGMHSHSSSTIAIKATEALSELLDREYASVDEFELDLERNAGALRRANPSHASLHNAVWAVQRAVVDAADTVEESKELTRDMIDRVIDDIETGKKRAAKNAADTFDDGETFMTHDFSSTALSAVETAADAGTQLTAYVKETRPRYIGRGTARMLAEIDPVDPHLMVDNAMGHYLPECDRVVIGMDCIVDDTLYNRVGTLPLAATAQKLGVEVVVVGSGAKVIKDGFAFENQFRAPEEVMLEPVEGITIENPSYDATPVELVDKLITDTGVHDL